nr:MetaGeneMark_Unknown Function [uncultured bacterium]
MGTHPDKVRPVAFDLLIDFLGKQFNRGASPIFPEVYRSLDGARSQERLAITGKRSFLDPNVPAGTASVGYTIVASRGDETSEPSDPALLVLTKTPVVEREYRVA